ncbi:E3 ubiquitin-protein ligase CCNB1IP1 like [Verticillium longisporum]|uniref:E3 ubiquitin-protein ligase CCNB1IP1 like n=1 Tax=Verticillium longisporum TaxID=100787 RepID=A0A8I3AN77_VERLO|nr:E3 ubiquitin-protein ligase CCNB1IP1 like [Verticillium longisporum]
MEHSLKCNVLKCRQEITDRALVTTCSHIFCIDCAGRSGLAGQSERRSSCPACNSNLGNPDDAVIAILSPSEEYKTSVLSGLSPNIIMECAGRALSFWAYQTTQEIVYQKYLEKTLTDKYKALDMHLDKTVNEANAEIESIQGQLRDLALQNDSMRRKYDELGQAFKDKSLDTQKAPMITPVRQRTRNTANIGLSAIPGLVAGSPVPLNGPTRMQEFNIREQSVVAGNRESGVGDPSINAAHLHHPTSSSATPVPRVPQRSILISSAFARP